MYQSKYMNVAIVGVLAALVSVSAFIRIPTPFIPFTLQTFVVLLAPLLFGAKRSALAVLLYLFLGLIGLPVFAGGGGIGYFLKPTFGYLIGFVIASVVVPFIANKSESIIYTIVGILVGIVVIHLCGVVYFYFNMHLVQAKEISAIAAVGVTAPSFLFDLGKAVFIVAIARKLRPLMQRYV